MAMNKAHQSYNI